MKINNINTIYRLQYLGDIIKILEYFLYGVSTPQDTKQKKKVMHIVLLDLRYRYKVNINRQDRKIIYGEETIDALRTATDRIDYYLSCIGRLVQSR